MAVICVGWDFLVVLLAVLSFSALKYRYLTILGYLHGISIEIC